MPAMYDTGYTVFNALNVLAGRKLCLFAQAAMHDAVQAD